MSYETTLRNFKEELLADDLDVDLLFKKYVIDSSSYYFSHVQTDAGLQDQIEADIAEYYGIETSEIFFVGSSQLGFSLNPKNLFNSFDYKFGETGQRRDKSDIDIAIVSPKLFNNLGRKTFEYTTYYKRQWGRNEYYDSKKAQGLFNVPLNYKFFEYYTKGWYRPDFKPAGFEYSLPRAYEDFRRIVYKKLKRKVSFGIYQDWYYFENYHLQTLTILKKKLQTEVL